jgi:para-aminobenzoate synthetase component I
MDLAQSLMPLRKSDEAFRRMDALGKAGTPFLFVLDYALERPLVLRLDEIDPGRLRFAFPNGSNLPEADAKPRNPEWGIRTIHSLDPEKYRQAFEIAHQAFMAGESYLLNLTASTPVDYCGRLPQLLEHLDAPYRLWVSGELLGQENEGFLVFSPESFIRMENDAIKTFPMKGSRRTSPEQREQAIRTLLEDPKEAAEHVTVVDLLRNDLARISTGVHVPRYRYVEDVRLPDSLLLQTSSEIVGELPSRWREQIGSILRELLPAGSVTGAPKRRTCEHIAIAERILGQSRGHYTGVCGLFDGTNLDSAVMIRFLEDVAPLDGQPDMRRGCFKSGGGLTVSSNWEREWEELNHKISLPLEPLLMETMCLRNGQLERIAEHQERTARSGIACFGKVPEWNWGHVFSTLSEASKAERVRVRLRYTSRNWELETFPYTLRRPDRLFVEDIGGLSYPHKHADRSGLDALRSSCAKKHGLDAGDLSWDLLLVRGDEILETSYTAVILEIDGLLWTPEHPMLPSTRIASLLRNSIVRPRRLLLKHLALASKLCLVNAMVGLEDAVTIAPNAVVLP